VFLRQEEIVTATVAKVLIVRGLLLGVTLLALLVPARVPAEDGARTISVLSYNVHGLFPLIAKDNPRDRMPIVGWLANKYDVALFQEDFEYSDLLDAQMSGSIGTRGNGMGWDPRRVAAKVLLAPVVVFLPHFGPPYGAGLSAFVKAPLLVPDDVNREPYHVCNGWFGANGDCWANKGFLRVGLRAAGDARIDVYTTHLEAGSSDESIAVRRAQLERLAAAVETLSEARAVIVAGDFNVGFNRPGDRELITEFRDRLGLRDSGAGPELPFWRERNYILYRGGAGVTLEVERAGEATEFVNRRRALSDHPALYARFRVESRRTEEGAR